MRLDLMETHYFVAKNMRTALQLVYEKLGAHALIISNKRTSEGVEIQATIKPEHDAPSPIQADIKTPIRMVPENSLSVLESEIKLLRQLLETQITELHKQPSAYKHPMHAIIHTACQELGFSDGLTHSLLKSLQPFESKKEGLELIKQSLIEKIQITGHDILRTGGIVALVGPTGVGKTTMMAKLATHFRLHNHHSDVALINADRYRVAAKEQVEAYASILNIEAYNIQHSIDLSQLFDKLSHKKLILVDTSGVMLETNDIMNRLSMIKEQNSLKCYLTISTSTSVDTLKNTLDLFSYLPLAGCILTKLDETVKLAPALSKLIEACLPIAYISTGQHVPDDFERAYPNKLIDQAFSAIKHTKKIKKEEVSTC